MTDGAATGDKRPVFWPFSFLLAVQAGAAPIPHEPFPISCAYFSARDLENVAACAGKTQRGYVIAPEVAADLSYREGLATLTFPGRQWFYRRHDGTMVEMLTFDNGPDYFEEGLARALVDGKIAYVDRRLRMRVRTRYDWADRFQHGRATVCIGCVSQRDASGEHSFMTGGRWGVIDRRGREVVPPTLTIEEFNRLPSSVTGLP